MLSVGEIDGLAFFTHMFLEIFPGLIEIPKIWCHPVGRCLRGWETHPTKGSLVQMIISVHCGMIFKLVLPFNPFIFSCFRKADSTFTQMQAPANAQSCASFDFAEARSRVSPPGHCRQMTWRQAQRVASWESYKFELRVSTKRALKCQSQVELDITISNKT